MFDSIINEAKDKLNLGDNAGSVLTSLIGLIINPANGGFSGFIERFRNVGLGDVVDSWISTGDNAPISNQQLESALGAETIDSVAEQTGVERENAATALSYLTPRVVATLTPDGEIPSEATLLSRVKGFLSEYGGAVGGAILGGLGTAGAFASGTADKAVDAATATLNRGNEMLGGNIDRVDAAAGAVKNNVSDTMNSVHDAADGNVDGDDGGILKWLIPLLLLGLAIVLGYMFCGKSTPIVNAPTNVNASKANTNANIMTAKTVDSSFSITAKDGKYVVTGIVPDQKTLDDIKAKLDAQFGAGNVDYTGLKVDANAKSFGAGWWDNFQKLLPNLKDWKNGTLSFAGNAITAASGLPAAAMEQLKSLFSGWAMPAMDGERKLTEVALPDGTKLQAYPGGIEDQLIKFIESDEYKNGTADTLKNKWFSFDDLNFKFGTTELVPESKRQLDNIVSILKAFPDVKIKIGGYTDKKGDDAANKKLSDTRAKAVKSALEKAGVGAQVPEAEGYGEEFATVPETASDEERQADRKTSVRLLK